MCALIAMAPLAITTTVPHAEGQEALLHEPWQIIVAIFLTSLAGILGGIAAVISARRARDVKQHLTRREMEEQKWRENNIGVANGHGSLMDQTAVLMQNQHDIMQSQSRDASALTDHIMSADSRLERIHDRLDAHISESATYRAGVENALGALADRLRAHDEWERSMKYPTKQGDQA